MVSFIPKTCEGSSYLMRVREQSQSVKVQDLIIFR